MNIAVTKQNGQDTGRKVKLSNDIFGIEPNDHAIYLDVKQYLANQRQGTHQSKERSQIVGSTRKIKRQKGTGTARAGSIKSPLFRGGGRTFGPRPRDYGFKLNKKVKNLAKKSALSYKAKENGISILEDFKFDAAKTKEYLALLKSLSLADKKTLMVLPASDQNIYLSARNIKRTKITTADQINTYDVVNADNVVFVESSVEKVEKSLS